MQTAIIIKRLKAEQERIEQRIDNLLKKKGK